MRNLWKVNDENTRAMCEMCSNWKQKPRSNGWNLFKIK